MPEPLEDIEISESQQSPLTDIDIEPVAAGTVDIPTEEAITPEEEAAGLRYGPMGQRTPIGPEWEQAGMIPEPTGRVRQAITSTITPTLKTAHTIAGLLPEIKAPRGEGVYPLPESEFTQEEMLALGRGRMGLPEEPTTAMRVGEFAGTLPYWSTGLRALAGLGKFGALGHAVKGAGAGGGTAALMGKSPEHIAEEAALWAGFEGAIHGAKPLFGWTKKKFQEWLKTPDGQIFMRNMREAAADSGMTTIFRVLFEKGPAAKEWVKKKAFDPYTKWTTEHIWNPAVEWLRTPRGQGRLGRFARFWQKGLFEQYGLRDPELLARGEKPGFLEALRRHNAQVAEGEEISLKAMNELLEKIPPELENAFFDVMEGTKPIDVLFEGGLEKLAIKYRLELDGITDMLVERGLVDPTTAMRGYGSYVTRVGAYMKFANKKDIAQGLRDEIGPENTDILLRAYKTKAPDLLETYGKLYNENPKTAWRKTADKYGPDTANSLEEIYDAGLEEILAEYNAVVGLIERVKGGDLISQNKFNADISDFMKTRGLVERGVPKKAMEERIAMSEGKPKGDRWQVLSEQRDGTYTMRIDWSPEVRQLVFRETKNPAFRIANHMERLQQKIADYDFMDAVNKGWGRPDPNKERYVRELDTWINEATNIRNDLPLIVNQADKAKLTARLNELDGMISTRKSWQNRLNEEIKAQGLVQLPNAKKYGNAAGQYVPEELHSYLTKINEGPNTFGQKLTEGYNKLFGRYWKVGKIVQNPATQLRNSYFNFMLADMEDTLLIDYLNSARHIKQLWSGEPGGLIGRLKKTGTGIFDTGFASSELVPIQELERTLAKAHKSGKTLDLDYMWDMLQKIAFEVPSKAYAFNENFFKLSVAQARLRQMGVKHWRNATEEQLVEAAQTAQKALFNYGEVSPYVDLLRKSPFGSPFATFSAKLAPRLLEIATKKPWKLAKWQLYGNGIQKIAQAKHGMSNEDLERTNRLRPEYQRNLSLPGGTELINKSLLLPWEIQTVDKDGNVTGNRPTYLDVGYILAQYELDGMFSSLLPGNAPAMRSAVELASNRQIYGNPIMETLKGFVGLPTQEGRPIYHRAADTKTQWMGAANRPGKLRYLSRQILPSVFGYGIPKMWSAQQGLTDHAGRQRKTWTTALDVLAGLKLNVSDPMRHADLESGLIEYKDIKELEGALNWLDKALDEGRITQEKYDYDYAIIEDLIDRAMDKQDRIERGFKKQRDFEQRRQGIDITR